MLSLRDFERRKGPMQEKMLQETMEHWEAARILTDETDKYTVEGPDINCSERLHLCKAACCRMHFMLSKQDLIEHEVRWDVGLPYQILQRRDGYCHHNHVTARNCTIHEKRPLVCRSYDCREDPRVWEDFEKAIPNPALNELR